MIEPESTTVTVAEEPKSDTQVHVGPAEAELGSKADKRRDNGRSAPICRRSSAAQAVVEQSAQDADRRGMALRARHPDRRLTERLALAAAFSLALLAWGLREFRQAL
jgi:hypothetical protein